MAGGFFEVHALIPAFLNLALVGILLALAYQRTGNLYFSIGLHAGWIFWLRSYGVFTRNSGSPLAWLFGSDKLIDGWLPLAVLALSLVVVMRLQTANPAAAGVNPSRS
jgi:membrane protease YdiL (CAAX protease family)